jgi:two-component system, sensor histidine kinase and response regulator
VVSLHHGSRRRLTMKMVSTDLTGLLLLTLVACAGIAWMAFQKRKAQALAGVLRAALDSAGAGILVVDGCGRIVASNRRFAEIWNIPESIVASRSDSQALACALGQLKSPESFLKKVEELYGNPEGDSDDTLEFKDGRVIRRHSEPLRVGGRSIGRIWEFWDVSEQVRVEEALAQERTLLHTLAESLPDYIYAKDTESRFLLVNTAGARMIGSISPAEVLGKTDADFYPAELASRYMADERRVWETGESLINREEPCVDAVTGAAKWLLTTKVPFRDASGKIRGLVGLGRDITAGKIAAEQLRAAKDEAEAASRAKSEFLANMSHEIRTPMNGILGMIGLALDSDLTPEQREYLGMARVSAESLLAVLNDILDLSKIEAGKLELESIDFDLRDNLETAVKTFAIPAHQKGLELTCDIHPDVPARVSGDPTRLREVVMNLVGNGIKFTESGEVVLEAGVDQTGSADEGVVALRFAVRDSGIGIPREKQKLVFQAFAQADGSTTRKHGGTGLGLTISARLVELMGGRMWLDSEAGHGSQFHFTAQFGKAWSETQDEDVEEAHLGGFRVLVVDDHATNRRVFLETLRRWEMAPEAVGSGSEALTCLQQAYDLGTPFRLVLADVNMPDTDGFALVEQIRQSRDFAGVAVIMATSATLGEDVERCRHLGIAAHLTKPVRQSDLRAAILVALGRGPSDQPCARLLERSQRERRRGLCILLAEDNLVNQKLATRLLEKAGHMVVVAANGRQALEALESANFDLVLMDVQMPEMDGLDAAAAIRERERRTLEHLPIIAMTAHAMKGDRERCLAAGMDGYIAKPIRPGDLCQAIEQFVLACALGSGAGDSGDPPISRVS